MFFEWNKLKTYNTIYFFNSEVSDKDRWNLSAI